MLIDPDRKVYQPRSINDALTIMRQRPDILVIAGGTEIQNLRPGTVSINQDILTLHNIEELRRIYRSDRILELGAMVSLERLTRFEDQIIPEGLEKLIRTIPYTPVRTLASIGGNLLVNPRYLSSIHYLSLANASVELRRLGGSRWIPVSRLRDGENHPQLNQELLCKIRIPVNVWNIQDYKRFYSRERDLDYGFCALAQVHRGIVEDLRLALVFESLESVRNRDADSRLIGRRLPLTKKETHGFLDELKESWKESGHYSQTDELIHQRLLNLAAGFLHSLSVF